MQDGNLVETLHRVKLLNYTTLGRITSLSLSLPFSFFSTIILISFELLMETIYLVPKIHTFITA